MNKLFLLTVILSFDLSFLSAQDGALDPTFGASGKVTTAIGSNDDGGRSAAIQADGKILVGGYTNGGASTNWDFALVRYKSDGSLDASFGTNGKVITAMGKGDDAISAVLIQPDKKIVVVGDADTTTTGIFRIALARYDTLGVLDPTFGTGGKVLTAVGNVNDRGNDAALQSDGKIVVAGRYTNGPTNDAKYRDIVVVRYNANGTLDPGFGTGGKVTTAIGNDADEPNGVTIQSDGKILVSGYTNNGTKNDIALLRYTANGTLDTGFGTGGIVTTSIGSLEDGALKVRLQADGKIVMAAYTDIGSGNIDCALLRYNTTGTLDATFGTGGKVITSFGSGFDAPLQCLILPNGKIVTTGISNNGSNFDFAVARYSSSGVLDAGFGTGGKVTTPIGSGDDMGFGAALQADGKIVLAGEANTGTNTDFAIVRYINSGATAVPDQNTPRGVPDYFSLSQNYPNPFNPSTVISYQLPVSSDVSLRIYDVLGREIGTLVSEQQSAGWKEVRWYASGVSSGVYVYKIEAGKFVDAKKMLLIK